MQQWLRDEGIDYPLVIGGYKAMRRFLLEELERSLARADIRPGQWQNRYRQDPGHLPPLARSVDLEGLANHRGSSFGQLPTPQPSQIDFENALSIALLQAAGGGVGADFSGGRGPPDRLSVPA